jgi:hypothetical protein
MATERNLPIKFFQKREKDESGTEGAGGGAMPKWVNKDNIAGKSIIFREKLIEVDQLLKRKINSDNYIPTVLRLKVNEDALAKRFRREIALIFNVDKKLNLIGFNSDSELLVKVDNARDVKKMIDNFAKADQSFISDSIIMGIDAIENIEVYHPVINVNPNSETKIKVKLFNYGDSELNRILIQSFESFCQSNDIDAEPTVYSADLNIYSIASITEDALDLLQDFDGIQMITEMPTYDITFDEMIGEEDIPVKYPKPGKEYPIVGILDSGVANIPHFEPWLENDRSTYFIDDVVNKGHGTFVAGVLLYGDDFQGNKYTGLEGCKIYEAIVIADKNKQAISEDELIENIRDAVSRNNHIKIWNLSLGTATEADLYEFSDFGKALDEIQDHNDVLICKSAGNCENFKFKAPKSRIANSADTVRGLVVGSISHDQNATDQVGKHNPSPFSRKGPGPSYTIKPDLTHIGGNAGLNSRNTAIYNTVKSFSTSGGIAHNVGTSFSTPRITAIAAGLNFKLNEVFSPTLLKGLIIHSAKYPDEMKMELAEKLNHAGFGLPTNIDDILYNEPNEITLILQDTLEKGSFIDILDFPFPQSMIDEDGYFYGEVTVTLVTSPILEVSQGVEYCQSNIDVMFGSYDNKVARDITQKTIKNPIGADNRQNLLAPNLYSRKTHKSVADKFATERMLISYGNKFQPVKKWCVNFDDFTPANKEHYLKGPKNWYLKLEGLFRHYTEAKAEAQNFTPSQEFCCIITIKDTKKRGNIYNEVTQLLNSFSFIHGNVKIRQEVEVRVDNKN